MLQVRPHMNNSKLPFRYVLSKKVVANVYVLRVWRGGRIIGQVQSAYVILENGSAPYVAIRKDKTLDVPQENRLLKPLSHRNIFCLRRRQCHTLLRPRQKRHASTSTHNNTATNISPVGGSAREIRIHKHLQTNTTRRTPLKSDTVATRESNVHENVQGRFPVHEFRCVKIPCHGSHRVKDIRTSLVRKSHQMSNQ